MTIGSPVTHRVHECNPMQRKVFHWDLRQEVEVHEIHAESDYDEKDDGPVAGAVAVEPFENLPHRSVPLTADRNF